MSGASVYISILLLLSIIAMIVNLYTSTKETFQEDQKREGRIALILRGEAFRKGSQGNRNYGNAESYEEQKAACMSHIELIRKIESQGYGVDVFIDTYHTNYDEELRGWYGDALKEARFHPTVLESQQALIKDALDMVSQVQSNYDSILILRIDLLLKSEFIERYRANTPTVQFVGILWTRNYKTAKNNPRINDIIYHFPKAYYEKMPLLYDQRQEDWQGHDLLDIAGLEYEKDYSLITTKFHDSDSQKDYNPYYRIVNRPENSVWHDGPSKEFPRDFV